MYVTSCAVDEVACFSLCLASTVVKGGIVLLLFPPLSSISSVFCQCGFKMTFNYTLDDDVTVNLAQSCFSLCNVRQCLGPSPVDLLLLLLPCSAHIKTLESVVFRHMFRLLMTPSVFRVVLVEDNTNDSQYLVKCREE